MAYVKTTLTAAVGEKWLGKAAPNKVDDVKKVQALLGKVFGSAAPAFKPGVCDDALKKAIGDFQRCWPGTADSTVDPNGQTLKRLDRLANPLILNPISLGRVLDQWVDGKMVSNGGGYNISVKSCDGGSLPLSGKGFALVLAVQNDSHTMDVSDRPASDLLTKDNLGQLLGIFDTLDTWAVPVQVKVQLRYRNEVITTSGAQNLQTPVRPHNGRMLPLDRTSNGAELTYQGDPEAADFHGRMFVEVPGYDKCLFVYAGQFETRNDNRGFDCITYAGTTCGAANVHMADSADLAGSLGASAVSINKVSTDAKGKPVTTKVTLDAADPADVREFFKGPSNGYYLMWSGGHIVLVANGTVHEFKASAPSGYTQTPVATWLEPYKSKKLTVRQLPAKPARAT